MQLTTTSSVSVVHQINCDRCGKEARRAATGFPGIASIGFQTEEGSIFGKNCRVEVDLCEHCVRETLGQWLRVQTSSDDPVNELLKRFVPERHGGEFPPIRERPADPA